MKPLLPALARQPTEDKGSADKNMPALRSTCELLQNKNKKTETAPKAKATAEAA